MKKREKFLLLFPTLLFFSVNILYSSYFLSAETTKERAKIRKAKKEGTVLSSATQSCSSACEELIDQKIAAALGSSSTSSSPQTSYIPLGSGGSTVNTSWTTLEGSEFNFDKSSYSSRAKAYWEGNLKSFSANSRCFVRLYDKTHYREVDYSEQTTSELSYQTLTSQPLSIWLGDNQYELQIKSLNGIECYLSSPNLIVKY